MPTGKRHDEDATCFYCMDNITANVNDASYFAVISAEPSTQVLVVVAAAFDRICFLQLLQIWVIESVVCVVCTLIYFCCSGC